MKQLVKNIGIITLLFFLFTSSTCSSTSNNQEEALESQEAVNEEVDEEEEEEEFPMPDIFIPEPGDNLPVSTFREVWGYVVAGQEAALLRGLPITDVGYFGAEVGQYGQLINVPRRQALAYFPGRVHLVVTCGSNALTYFALKPESEERAALITDLITATRNFDGLQIDFENIPPRSGDAFLSFLGELRDGLPDKMFTIALYSRTRRLQNDVYDYERIKPYVDRILVMGYDEHWGGGPAGPVASLQWCRRVAEYSLRVIGEDKLIMGLPFYGRAWANQNHHRALIYTTTERLINTYNATVRRENGIPTFDYNVNISVKVYFEDEYSLSTRMEMYKSMGVKAIGFWRIGQETRRVWNILAVE